MKIAKFKIYSGELKKLADHLTTLHSYKYINMTTELAVLATENYYLRNDSTQLNMIVLKQLNDGLQIDVLGAAGGTGLFKISLGSEKHFIKRTQKTIEEYCGNHGLKLEEIKSSESLKT